MICDEPVVGCGNWLGLRPTMNDQKDTATISERVLFEMRANMKYRNSSCGCVRGKRSL